MAAFRRAGACVPRMRERAAAVSVCQRCGREYRPLRKGLCGNCYMRRRKMVGYECSYVDAEPVRQHVHRLRAAGLGTRRISELAGVQRSILQALTQGRSRGGRPGAPSRRVARHTAERILAVPIPETHACLVADGTYVAGVGTARRLQALVAIGYTQTYLARRIGWSPENIPRLFRPTPVEASTARKVADLFEELQIRPGPSIRARLSAKRKGWAPPLAWDEHTIDDPDAAPNFGEREQVSFPDRYGEMRMLG